MADVLDRHSLVRSLVIQRRVLGALLMREILTRYGRENLGFLWLFIEPMLFTLGVTALWTLTKLTLGSSLPIVAFALTGYSSVLLWRNCASRCSMAIPPNLGLLYHRNVRVLDLLVARVLLEIAGATISFFGLACVFVSLGMMDWPMDVTGVISGWLLLAWFGTSIALVIGALTAYSQVVERLWHPAAYLLFPISGAVFMVDWLPRELQEFVLLVPMVNGVELVREGYFGSVVRTHYDLPYLVAWCLALSLLGLALVRNAGRRVEIE